MNNQHTPGPWDTDTSTGWVGLRGNYRVIARVRRTAPYGAVDLGEEGNANARLIAAAPDLLEALQAVLEVTENGTCINLKDERDPIIQNALAAIAKATTTQEE